MDPIVGTPTIANTGIAARGAIINSAPREPVAAEDIRDSPGSGPTPIGTTGGDADGLSESGHGLEK
jgi:hypothetical protein